MRSGATLVAFPLHSPSSSVTLSLAVASVLAVWCSPPPPTPWDASIACRSYIARSGHPWQRTPRARRKLPKPSRQPGGDVVLFCDVLYVMTRLHCIALSAPCSPYLHKTASFMMHCGIVVDGCIVSAEPPLSTVVSNGDVGAPHLAIRK